MSHLLVIDIGSSQITAAVAELSDNRRIVVRGLGRARSGGLKQGVVIQIDSVVEALVRRWPKRTKWQVPNSPIRWSRSVAHICLDRTFQEP